MDENRNKEDTYELDRIRMQKIKELLEAQKRKQQKEELKSSFQDKIEYLLRVVLDPEAYTYFNKLKQAELWVYQRIYNELISPDVIRNIDYLLAIIARQGGVPRRIPVDVIMYLERKVKGIKGTIKVKRGDEILDLGSYLTKNK
ncbi:MAG: hypothetical protein ACTSXH_17225 [Promethearchaeota archaeon]